MRLPGRVKALEQRDRAVIGFVCLEGSAYGQRHERVANRLSSPTNPANSQHSNGTNPTTPLAFHQTRPHAGDAPNRSAHPRTAINTTTDSTHPDGPPTPAALSAPSIRQTLSAPTKPSTYPPQLGQRRHREYHDGDDQRRVAQVELIVAVVQLVIGYLVFVGLGFQLLLLLRLGRGLGS